MLIVPSFIAPSELHGFGCYSCQPIEAGALVWVYNPEIDRELEPNPPDWQRHRAYGSNTRHGRLVLPGDNACWINFSDNPNLVEAEELGGEYCLRACRKIRACEELTVFPDSDADAEWKLKCTKEGTNLLSALPGRSAETANSRSVSSAPAATSRKTAKN